MLMEIKMDSRDTICAVATGLGRTGIGIVRVSGKDAIKICDQVFEGRKKISEMPTYTAAFGNIVDVSADGKKEIIDETVALVMKGPHSYTTEDTVEFDCHGGPFLLGKVVDLLIRSGVRAAEPGEFTKRAYLGGRIDMTEAEAVMDIINAENDMALKSSLSQLRGGLKEKIEEIREKIIYNTAFIESALDDPENYSLDGFSERLDKELDGTLSEIENLLSTSEDGRLIKEGISTAIIGRPNAGKSSVLNMLLGEERAIVTNIEGTTRDTLEEYANLNGVTLRLIDTAGIRNTDDIVEKIGVDKAKENIESADLILFIVDGAVPLNDNDREIIKKIKENDKNVITLINKTDLESVMDKEELKNLISFKKDNQILEISAKEGTGKEELSNLIRDMFFSGNIDYNSEIYITSKRHRQALYDAKNSLLKVKESIALSMSEDFFTTDLMAAYESLGLIIGVTLEDDLADKIFESFCMGK